MIFKQNSLSLQQKQRIFHSDDCIFSFAFPLSLFIYNVVYTVDAFIVEKKLLIHGLTHFPKVKSTFKNFYLRADPYKI